MRWSSELKPRLAFIRTSRVNPHSSAVGAI
jgi:hypothetical protein